MRVNYIIDREALTDKDILDAEVYGHPLEGIIEEDEVPKVYAYALPTELVIRIRLDGVKDE